MKLGQTLTTMAKWYSSKKLGEQKNTHASKLRGAIENKAPTNSSSSIITRKATIYSALSNQSFEFSSQTLTMDEEDREKERGRK